MWLLVIFTKCHKGQEYLKWQKWLIWTKVANTWVGMGMTLCSEKFQEQKMNMNLKIKRWTRGLEWLEQFDQRGTKALVLWRLGDEHE